MQRHTLTGVLKCSKCEHHLSGQWAMQKTGGPRGHSIVYGCKRCRGVSIRAEHVEPLLVRLFGGRLAAPDAIDLLKADQHDPAEAQQLHDEKAVLYGKLDELAVGARALGQLTGRQVQIASEVIQQQIAAIEQK